MEIEKIKLIAYWSGFLFWLGLESFYSYRVPSVSRVKRWLTNIPLSLVNGALYNLIYFTVIGAMLASVSQKRSGLLNSIDIPSWLHFILGIIILDFVIYLWHLMNHKVPLFWRFHKVHHSDMNMDVTTSSRFHFGEFLLSGLVRLCVIYLFGIAYLSYIIFEIAVNLAVQFHHSSIKIHSGFEKIWMLLFVPPSMHRIHHSVIIRERDSNYGVIFSTWDRLVGTFTREVDQEKLIIGLGSHRDFDKLAFWQMLIFPFTRK